MIPLITLLISVTVQAFFLLSKQNQLRITLSPQALISGIFLIKLALVTLLATEFNVIGFDLYGFYDHGKFILSGLVPARDYYTPYSIGYEYLLGICTYLYDSPISIALLFLVLEGLFYLGTVNAFSHQTTAFTNSFIVTLSTNPFFLFFTIIDKQDEILLLACIPVMLLRSIHKNRLVLYSFLVIFFTKILALVLIIPLFKHRLTKLLSLVVLLACFYISLYNVGFSKIFSMCFSRTDGTKDALLDAGTSGNLWYILFYIFERAVPQVVPRTCLVLSLILFNVYMLLFHNPKTITKFYLLYAICNLLIIVCIYKMTFAYYHWVIFTLITLHNVFFMGNNIIIRWLLLLYSTFTMAEGIITFYTLFNQVRPTQLLGVMFIGYQVITVSINVFLLLFFIDKIRSNREVSTHVDSMVMTNLF